MKPSLTASAAILPIFEILFFSYFYISVIFSEISVFKRPDKRFFTSSINS